MSKIADYPNEIEQYALEPFFGRIISPFERFLRRTTAGGIILIVTTIVTLILANSGWGDSFLHLWELPVRVGIGSLYLELTLHQSINDGLMTLFFLLVGLELKREIIAGELSSMRDAALPVLAALGGMLVPALIYRFFNPDLPEASGWGIPMATDIAFSIGILVLLSWRIPRGLIIFLTALAIADDLGAVLIIAVFYSRGLNVVAMGAAGAVLLGLVVLNQGGIRHYLPYALLGLLLWLCLLRSGIHPTIAGVLLAATIPARPAFTPRQLGDRMDQLQQVLTASSEDPISCEHPLNCPAMLTVAENLEKAARAVQPPQQRIEHALSPWVSFIVIPIFALSNAGIDFSTLGRGNVLGHPVTLGIISGLVIGKFVGITLFSWMAVRFGIGRLPAGVSWSHLMGVSWLGGIGFTMSFFIDGLAFDTMSMIEQAKFGILAGSLISAIIGTTWLFFAKRPRTSYP